MCLAGEVAAGSKLGETRSFGMALESGGRNKEWSEAASASSVPNIKSLCVEKQHKGPLVPGANTCAGTVFFNPRTQPIWRG